MNEAPVFEGWAVVELMGHRKLAGYVREQQVAGAGFLRIDVPGDGDESIATQIYSPGAIYCLTPVTEELARRVAKTYRPEPVTRWEIPALPAPRATGGAPDDDPDDDEDPSRG